jgi:hypothetical protein
VPEVAVIESIVGAAGGCATRTDVSVGALNDVLERVLVARSLMLPLLRSSDVVSEIPSVSNSSGSEVTVYRKRAVRESGIDTKVAYSVELPTVSVRRGVPVTVIDSEKRTVKVGVSEGIYVLLAGAVTVEIVGAV